MNKKLEKWLPLLYFFYKCKFVFVMVFFLDNYILAPFFILLYEMWGFPNKWCGENPRNLHFSRFYDNTNETDFGILRNAQWIYFGCCDPTVFFYLHNRF